MSTRVSQILMNQNDPDSYNERADYFSASETCRQQIVRNVVRLPGCVPKAVVTFACEGTCHSRNVPDWRFLEQDVHMIEHCTCCQPNIVRCRNVTFECPGRKSLTKCLAATFECACRPCSDADPSAEKPYDY
ncbi:hypothetical protein SNE40_013799 [Patella caerulea]|uniref:Bursicon n=1 Tax=Patella caerulea TaxID=87958 RepID=A0AAN8JGS5_PATCE